MYHLRFLDSSMVHLCPYSEECMYGALHLANLDWELF